MDMYTTNILGLEYPAAIPAVSDMFDDLSWGNDVTDKLVFMDADGAIYRLWVNDPDPEKREYEDDARYVLEIYTKPVLDEITSLGEWHDGWADDGAWDELGQVETPEELLQLLGIDPDLGWSAQNDKLMAEVGFAREGLGGNTEGYVKRDPTIGEVTVTSAHFHGQAPTGLYEQVLVTFTGFQHSEELLSLQLPLDTFVKQVKAARAAS